MTITRTLALRGAAGLAALTAGAALTIGMTTALFSDSETRNANTFTAGTVTVGLGSISIDRSVEHLLRFPVRAKSSVPTIPNAVHGPSTDVNSG